MAKHTPSIPQKILAALVHLKTYNFSAYIKALASIGADISAELAEKKTIQWDENNFTVIKAWPIEDIQKLYLSAALFATIWSPSELTKNAEQALSSSVKQSASPKVKQNLNTSSRHAIHLGLFAIENVLQVCFDQKAFQYEYALKDLLKINADIKISQSIVQYKTPRQKIVRGVSKALAITSSVTFGLIETGVAVFFVGIMLFSPVGWMAMAALLGGSVLLGGIFSYISYCTLREDIPAIVQEVAGRDQLLQGFLQYKNEQGKIEHFSRKQTAALGIFSVFFALPTAIAAGAFGFTSVLSISAILGIFGLTVASSIFPPIGVAVAVAITAVMALFFIRSFHGLIAHHQGNLLSFLRKPFDQISETINTKISKIEHPKANRAAKVFAYGAAGITALMGIAGLAISSATGINSATALIIKLFQAPIKIGASIGIASGIISFISRSFSTIAKCSGAVVNLIKLACHRTKSKVDKFGLVTGIFIDLPLSVLSWMDALLRPPASSPILTMPSDIKSAAIIASFTTVKDAGLIVNSMFDNKEALSPNGVENKKSIQTIAGEVAKNKNFVKYPKQLKEFKNFGFFKEKNIQELAASQSNIEDHSSLFIAPK